MDIYIFIYVKGEGEREREYLLYCVEKIWIELRIYMN